MDAGLEQARGIVNDLLGRVRSLSFDLRPAALDQFGLLPALLALFERFTDQTGVQVEFKHEGIEGRFPPEVETTAYRIVQEALTNIARHAGVGTATVRVWSAAESLGLQIEDRGRGFHPEVRPGGDAVHMAWPACRSASTCWVVIWRSSPGRGKAHG